MQVLVSCEWCGRPLHERIGSAANMRSPWVCSRCLEVETSDRPPWWLGLFVALGIAGAFVGFALVCRWVMALARQ